jgi:branched-chain amino acid transport system substrate-binding protein
MKRCHSMVGQTGAAAVVALGLISGAAAQSTIKIGMVQPLTGASAAAGTDVVNGAKIAVDEINAKGGVLGKELELVIEDTKSNPTEAREAHRSRQGSGAHGRFLIDSNARRDAEADGIQGADAGRDIVVVENHGGRQSVYFPHRAAVRSRSGRVGKIVKKIGIKKADFLVVNNDWGRGTADEFSKVLKDNGIAVGLVERMDQGAQDMNAQLVKLKGSGADTLFLTTAVEQLSLVLKQAASLGLNVRMISTGGSQNPDQLITNVGKAADGTWHLVFFTPWSPEATPDPAAAKAFVAESNKRALPFGSLTSSFRG